MRRRCFTLVELLVVIAVIALLAAILLLVLRSSRQHAKAVLCRSNVRQLTFGLLMYETESQTFPYGFYGTFDPLKPPTPPPGGYAGNPTYDKMGWWWFNYACDFPGRNRGKKSTLWCPSRPVTDPKLDYVLHSNYGVNRSICKSPGNIQSDRNEFLGTPLRRIDMPHPGRTLLIVDSGYSIISWWHATDVPPVALRDTVIEDTAYVPGLDINKDKNLWPGQEQDAINGRHPNKTVNVGFADGHVDRSKANDLLVEKADDVYRNRIPLWSPK